jgi:DivIVA domain-containing protein
VNRDQIERQDFPSVRRGYDAAAVHEHLRRVADEFEALGRAAADRPAATTLAEGAAERVRAILEAAEASARQLRDEAGREASGHVERVEEAAKQMLGKLDGLQSELDRLLRGLRSSAEALAGSLEQLRGDAGALGGGDAPAAAEEPSAPSRNGDRSDDDAGARLVALNMALEGSPRDATARYLAEHYELADVDALLDDVYTSAGK